MDTNQRQNQQKNYIATEKSVIDLLGIRQGSKVKVLRAAESGEGGWKSNWNGPFMNYSVGGTFTVKEVTEDGYGIRLDNDFYYPFFALQVLPNPNFTVKLSSVSEYIAEVDHRTGVVTVGCQKIAPAIIEQIYKATQRAIRGISESSF